MALESPSHTFASANPEVFSLTDDRPYAAVLLVNRVGNESPMQFGGPQITASTGGKQLAPGEAYLIAVPGWPARLTQVWVAGAVGEVMDSICFPFC